MGRQGIMDVMSSNNISVIVPVYNKEKYLVRCLESIIKQTFKNLEIILVDDGSTDSSGEICERYALKDSRIKVIHKTNGGVGSAKNAGLDAATGEYIAWCDPDDWANLDMYEYLYNKITQYEAQLAMCGYFVEYDTWYDEKSFPQELCFTASDALGLLLEDHDMRNYMWCCLFKRELFEGKRFKNIKIFEDVDIMWRVLSDAKNVICLPKCKYHYVQYKDSITGSEYKFSSAITFLRIMYERYYALHKIYPQYKTIMKLQCIVFARDVWCLYNTATVLEKKNSKEFLESCTVFYKQFYESVKKYIYLDKISNNVDGLLGSLSSNAFDKAYLYNQMREKSGTGRVSGFNGIDRNKIRVTYELKTKLEPVFEGVTIPIVFAANDSYCPILSVMIQSIIECSSENNCYDIIILNRDISLLNKGRLKSIAKGLKNFSIRFLNVASSIEAYSLFVGGKQDFTIDSYLRLLIPEVLSDKYHKAIYLDGDMIAMDDIAELMKVDVSGVLVASCRDLSGLGCYYDKNDTRRDYRDNVLKLKNPNDYFISGIIILNLDKFRMKFTSEWLLNFAASRNWLQHDQDVMNVLCDDGGAKIIHAQWNVLKMYNAHLLPRQYHQELLDSYEDPKIVHFGGDEKPWKRLDAIFFEKFWQIAARSPYYTELICIALQGLKYNKMSNAQQELNDVKNGLSFRIGRVITWLPRKLLGRK